MNRGLVLLFVTAILALPGSAGADELTAIVQKDLQTLGYDPGNTDGEASVQTVVAVSKFQAEHDLEVTGEITPQLAGMLKAEISKGARPAPAAAVAAAPQPAPAPAPVDAAALRAAQQACLQERAAAAQQSQQRKRGLGSLMRAVGRTAGRLGSSDTARTVAETSADIQTASAVAADLESAARDLGLTESDIEACRNPQ